MRASGGWRRWCAVCVLLVAGTARSQSPDADRLVKVSAALASGDRAAGDALAALAAAALEQSGVRARTVPPPAECAAGVAASDVCVTATLRALVRGAVHVALLAVPAARPPHVLHLRDAGLEELGDVAPAASLVCLTTRSARTPRSLLDFADADVAAQYEVPPGELAAAAHATHGAPRLVSAPFNGTQSPACAAPCATLLADTDTDARLLAQVAREYQLRVRVLTAERAAAGVAARLARADLPVLVCARAPALDARFHALGSPPCSTACPFEPYRLVKVVNARELAYSPSALRVLARMALSRVELRALTQSARAAGAETAVRQALAQHGAWTRAPAEVRAAVLVPASSRRDAYDADALRAAAALAEEDAAAGGAVRFKVEVVDDGCAAPLAFKYLTDALGAEYGALSAVAGPACGAAFADVARQGPSLSLPVIAYTAQAPPSAGGGLTLLAAGDSRLHTAVWAQFLAHMRWRRVAVLSELATRAGLDVAALGADVLEHVELPGDGDEPNLELISQWARRAAALRARVLLVSAEDARVVRAAVCAGRSAGLSAAEGAVWLLPPAARLGPRPTEAHNCTRAELEEAADGRLSVAPVWQAEWEAGAAWAERVRARCRRLARGLGACVRPDAHAALLYDALRLWAGALQRVLAGRPAALDDLHQKHVVAALVEDATSTPYSGVTGEFRWSGAAGARARSSPLALLQWHNGTLRRVADVEPGARLRVRGAALRWATADARAPDDGGERCALQPLADALHVDCRAVIGLLSALALLLLLAALGGVVWHCKRRADRLYRDRLIALGMRALSPKAGDLDRWEVPRERVVINRKLGTGAFGTVYGGHALLAEDRGWTAVAVKTLKAGASTDEKLDFLSEAEAMKRFEHKNVVRLLGVVTRSEPVCTVMEFMLYGDLKTYLLARRHLAGADDSADEVSPARLTAMARDAARALAYLAQLRYVHRDVAARNCLVSARRVLKLADFGMTRLVYENDYYRFSRKGMLPVRWMAPESLALGVFSAASDVWAFGVLLYEMATLGALPYQGLSNAEVLARVKDGHTLALPPGLKPQLQGLIKSCWQRQPRARPRAAEVAALLAEAPRLLTPCLDVPLDALPLAASRDTDTTYLSDDAAPQDTDAFLG